MPFLTSRVRCGAGPAAPLLLALLAVMLAGCTGQTRVSGSRPEGAPRDQTFNRVLIVGVSPHINQRCRFEQFLASQLRSAATVAIQSCDVVDRKTPLTRASIEAAVAAQQADAVVATILVGKDWAPREGGDQDTRGSASYKATDAGLATGYYGMYGVPVIYGEFDTAPSAITMEGDVVVTSKVFETRGPALVYTMETRASDIESTDQGVALIAAGVAERLRKEEFVR